MYIEKSTKCDQNGKSREEEEAKCERADNTRLDTEFCERAITRVERMRTERGMLTQTEKCERTEERESEAEKCESMCSAAVASLCLPECCVRPDMDAKNKKPSARQPLYSRARIHL